MEIPGVWICEWRGAPGAWRELLRAGSCKECASAFNRNLFALVVRLGCKVHLTSCRFLFDLLRDLKFWGSAKRVGPLCGLSCRSSHVLSLCCACTVVREEGRKPDFRCRRETLICVRLKRTLTYEHQSAHPLGSKLSPQSWRLQ